MHLIAKTVLSLLLTALPSVASESRTAADYEAFKEHIKAIRQTEYIHQVFQNELMRISTGSAGLPSPDVAKLLDNSDNAHPDIGDARVPLHLRLIERERLTFASGIQMLRSTLGQWVPTMRLALDALFAADVRQRELARLQCKRETRARYRREAHELNMVQEKTISQLKLENGAWRALRAMDNSAGE